jgi:hypothetical protein
MCVALQYVPRAMPRAGVQRRRLKENIEASTFSLGMPPDRTRPRTVSAPVLVLVHLLGVTVAADSCDATCESGKPGCSTAAGHQRALITGVSGMIGSHIARALVELRPCTKIYGIVRSRTDLSTLRGVLEHVHLLNGDITDGPRMREVFDQVKPHYLYHMAAQAINGISYTIPDVTIDVNVRGTLGAHGKRSSTHSALWTRLDAFPLTSGFVDCACACEQSCSMRCAVQRARGGAT